MQAIRQRIANRTLPPGAKLPSIRAFADQQKVSKSTVVEAYDRLAAEGIIQSRPGSGFTVAGVSLPPSLADVAPHLAPHLDRAVDPLWVSRQSLEAAPETPKPGCGWLPPSWMPETALRRTMRGLARAGVMTLTDYAPPQGLPGLRHLLARRLAERGIDAGPDQILLTDSTTQSIDLLCRLLLEPGDTVLLDDPCYFNYHALLRTHRVRVVTVPYTQSGPDLDRFAEILAVDRPRVYITNATLQNPTGVTIAPVVAHRLLKLAEPSGLIIIEDDIFADFEMEPAPRLAAFDGLDRVIHIGSFSKTLSASMRCGFIAARAEWIEGLIDLKVATTFGSVRVSAEAVLSVLTDGSYRKHLETLRQRLSKARVEAIGHLAGLGIVPWMEPRAGMFLWCRLPEGVDAADLARRALAEDIVLAPGTVFSLGPAASQYMRFNVAQSLDRALFERLKSLMSPAIPR